MVFPMMIAPAAISRSTITGLAFGTQSAKTCEPRVVTLPAIGVKSLIATGRPCSGPSCTPFRTAVSHSRAHALASSR